MRGLPLTREDLKNPRIEDHRAEYWGFKPKVEELLLKTRNLRNELLIENDCLKAS